MKITIMKKPTVEVPLYNKEVALAQIGYTGFSKIVHRYWAEAYGHVKKNKKKYICL